MKRTLYFVLCAVLTLLLASNDSFAQPQYYNAFTGNSTNHFPLNSTTNKVQWVYAPSVFHSNGTTGTPAPMGAITKIYFKMGGTINAASAYTSFSLSLGQNVGTINVFPNTTFTGGLTQVFSQSSFKFTGAVANQWYGFTLPAPFLYNPTLSLVFEMTTTSTAGGNTVSQTLGTGFERIWGANSAVSGSGGNGLVDFGFDIINLMPPVVSGGGVFCVGQNTVLTATPSFPMTNPSYWWTLPNGTNIVTPSITLNNLQISDAGNYTVRTIGAAWVGGPIDTSSAAVVNITVNPIPGRPVVAPVITYCQGEPFDSIQIYGENLKWYTVPTGGTPGPYPALNTSQPSTVT
ncbi:MAG TPA: hypothetical protein PL009_15225, partial [Flavipsychrobacter sp.]|nr:hypothetical protein [Flavipsychrobacter sp.]